MSVISTFPVRETIKYSVYLHYTHILLAAVHYPAPESVPASINHITIDTVSVASGQCNYLTTVYLSPEYTGDSVKHVSGSGTALSNR